MTGSGGNPGILQYAQMLPAELTGMNWPLPMYCNSTAEP